MQRNLISIPTDQWLVLGVTSAILAAIMLIAPERELFGFGPLHAHDLALALVTGFVGLVLLYILKRTIGPGAKAI